jgi:hypothetical protein
MRSTRCHSSTCARLSRARPCRRQTELINTQPQAIHPSTTWNRNFYTGSRLKITPISYMVFYPLCIYIFDYQLSFLLIYFSSFYWLIATFNREWPNVDSFALKQHSIFMVRSNRIDWISRHSILTFSYHCDILLLKSKHQKSRPFWWVVVVIKTPKYNFLGTISAGV